MTPPFSPHVDPAGWTGHDTTDEAGFWEGDHHDDWRSLA